MLLKNGSWSWHSPAAFTFKRPVSTDDFFPGVKEKIKINKGGRAKCSPTLLLPLESWELRLDNLKIASIAFCHPSRNTCSGLVSVHMLSVHTVSGAQLRESVFVEGSAVPQKALLRHMECLESLVWCQRGGVSLCLPHQRAWHFQKSCLSPKSVPYHCRDSPLLLVSPGTGRGFCSSIPVFCFFKFRSHPHTWAAALPGPTSAGLSSLVSLGRQEEVNLCLS